jgi:hypothetical protein
MKILKYNNYIALAIFLLALWLPAMHLDTHASKSSIERWNSQFHAINVWHGWQVLLFGFPSLFWGVPGWLANVSFAYSLTNKKFSGICSIISIILAGMSVRIFGIEFPADEAGVNVFNIGHFSIGFYVWFFAIIFLGFSNIYLYFYKKEVYE